MHTVYRSPGRQTRIVSQSQYNDIDNSTAHDTTIHLQAGSMKHITGLGIHFECRVHLSTALGTKIP